MKDILLLCCAAITMTNLLGQTLQKRSSFYENAFVWNPALTAQWYNWEVSATHHQSWLGFDGAPRTTTIAIQTPLSDAFFRSQASFGAYLQQDKIGPYQSTALAGTYAYKVNPRFGGNKKDVLAMGILASVEFRNFDFAQLEAYDESEFGVNLDNAATQSSPNISIGLFYRSNNYLMREQDHYYIGAAIKNLIPYDLQQTSFQQFSRNMHLQAHGGVRKFLYSGLFVEPSIVVHWAGHKAYEAMGAVRLENPRAFWIAGGLATSQEVFAQVGAIFDGRSPIGHIVGDGVFRIGAKADYRLHALSNQAGIGFEVYLAYQYDIE